MLELPEAVTVARQLRESVTARCVATVAANHSPHRWAWFGGDPAAYHDRLAGLQVQGAQAHGGMVELDLGPRVLVFAEGVSPRYHAAGATPPAKHQLLLTFADGAFLCASVQMYGGLWCWEAGAVDNPYYQQARRRPSPLAAGFDAEYFASLIASVAGQDLSVKAFLATEQRIPGLGNGVLQDILLAAGQHPRRKLASLTAADHQSLLTAVRHVLAEMAQAGGRDTERDLFGQPGGYRTRLSRLTVGRPCAVCGTPIAKANYLGGSIYFCPQCQPV